MRDNIQLNDYVCSRQTENTYESLHITPAETRSRPSVLSQTVWREKPVVFLLAINAALLAVILAIVSVHYAHFTRLNSSSSCNAVVPHTEMWNLHNDMFYLLWSDPGSCEEAERFCAKRAAELVTVDHQNQGWLESMVRGKQMWTKFSKISGSGFNGYMDIELCPCDVFPEDFSTLECEGPYIWVCQRASSKVQDIF